MEGIFFATKLYFLMIFNPGYTNNGQLALRLYLWLTISAGGLMGISIQNSVPFPTSEMHSIIPPCFSTII
jgi:hypothetical protein